MKLFNSKRRKKRNSERIINRLRKLYPELEWQYEPIDIYPWKGYNAYGEVEKEIGGFVSVHDEYFYESESTTYYDTDGNLVRI